MAATAITPTRATPFSDAYPIDLSPVSLVWRNMSVVGDGGKILLHNTSGVVRPGVTAVIAPTGSGKTTFLNALTGATRTATVHGDVRLNGKAVSGRTCKTLVSYVAQEDVLDAHLTVQECMDFAAGLQLGHFPAEERAKIVANLLEEIGIAHVNDTLVGSATVRGVSGGQRKRVSIALGLLRRPRVIVMDEPTCGLDSTTALNIIQSLHRITSRCGVVVLMAIHQPQQAIFNLFDQLILIRGGRLLYHGNAKACITMMGELGFAHDGITGYADHIVEVISPALGQTMEEKHRTCAVLKAYTMPDVDLDDNNDTVLTSTVTQQSWVGQFGVCFGRIGRAEVRKYGAHVMNLISTLGCALLIGGVYYDIPVTQAGARLRLALLFFCCINQSLFGAMKVILAFPDVRALTLAERRAGLYSMSPYFIAYSAVDLIYGIVWPFIFALPVVYMSGLQTGARFLGFVFILYLDKLCATSLAMSIAAITRITSAALVVCPMALETSRLFSGFFLAPNAVPSYFVWLDPLSYVKYAFVGAALNELPPVVYECVGTSFNATTNTTRRGICNPTLPQTGNDQIVGNGYDYISYGGCVGVLIGYLIFVRFVAYVAMLKLKS
jgi:ATP-binding cassette subfamily G (WHITE) protein 2